MVLLPLSPNFRQEFKSAPDGSAERDVIRRYFDVYRVDSEADIKRDSIYYIEAKIKTYLVHTPPALPQSDSVPLTLILTGEPLNPLPKDKFLEFGQKGQVQRLIAKDRIGDPSGPTDVSAETKNAQTAKRKSGTIVLDAGSFTQLFDAAKRSGLVPNADVIAHVRDREFRKRNYVRARQDIEILFGKFASSIRRREERLRQEYTDIASGKIKISIRDLQMKKMQDTADTQKIERARRRFLRVIDGLRILGRKSEDF